MIQQVTPFWTTPRLTGFLITRLLVLLFFGEVATTAAAKPADGSVADLVSSDTTISVSICATETYLFDGQLLDASGNYTAVFTTSDGSDSTVTLLLTVFPLVTDTITASICAGGTYPFFGLALDATGVYDAVLTGANGCDSTIVLQLTVLQHANTQLSAGICSGTAFDYQGESLTESGTYLFVLTAANGCDSLVTLKLDVVDYFEVQESARICPGESYLFGDTLLFVPGVYVDSLTAAGGCDSIVTLTLGLYPPLLTQINAAICDGASFVFHGDTLSTAGVYTYAESGSNGCDSIVILHLETVAFFETTQDAIICDGETYSFGAQELTQPGVYHETLTAIGGCDSILTLTLTVLPNATGTDGATVCDGEVFIYHGETLSNPGEYVFALESANGCDSTVTFTLTVLEAPNTVEEATICYGETYSFYGQELDEEGVYEEIFVAANGCDSTVSLLLTVLPELSSALESTICAGDVYDFYGNLLDQSGVYTQVLVADNGCDSTVTLTLTVLPAQHTALEAVVCAGETYGFDGVDLTETGIYTGVFSDANGCDSTVTLNLEVLPVKQTDIEASICDGTSYPFNGVLLTEAGVYASVLTGAYGCDSTVTLTLTVLPTQTTVIDATICEGDAYDYFGQLLTENGVYEYGYIGENGCDSTVTVNLIVAPLQYASLEAEICTGESYEYNGTLLTEAGAYDFTFPGSNGCDSIFTVHLTVHPVFTTNLNIVQCEGTSYTFNGADLTASGFYSADYQSVYGCDSTVNLNLTFVGQFETAFEVSVCAGQSFEFGADTLTDSGEYTLILPATGGCDSIVTLTLTVLPAIVNTTDATICAGESFVFNGAVLSDAGVYTAIATAANGCDSTTILNLQVLPASSASVEATICANETYAFNGATLDEAGDYTGVLTAANGCDSTVTLHLTVLPLATSAIAATICAGETYDFNGQILNETGVYSMSYPAANGCDSVVTLDLTVLPPAQGAFAATVCGGQSFEFNGEVFTQSGVFSFLLEHAAFNGCDSLVTLFLTIFPAIPPTTVDAAICSGGFYTIAGQTISDGGQYTFNLASSSGCDSIVVLNLTVLPISVTSIHQILCEGDPGVFTAVYQNIYGCDSTVTITVTVEPASVTVALNNGVLTATSPGAAFQWIDCANNQPIPGATGSSYTPTATGQYAVIATNAVGCTAVSACVTVIVVSVKEPLTAPDWVLQPNPAQNHTSIVLREAIASETWAEVFDAAGRLLWQQAVPAGAQQLDLDLSGFADGMLLVRLKNKDGISSKLLMKGN